MTSVRRMGLRLLAAAAIGLVPLASATDAPATGKVELRCGATEIGVPKNCDEALPRLANETGEKSVQFGFSIEPKDSSFSIADNGCGAGLTGTDGQTCSVVIRFAPTQAENTATLTISQIVEGKPPTRYRDTVYSLSGQGTRKLGISASSVQFDSQQTSTSSEPKGLTFTNNSGTTIHIKSIVTHGDFAVSETELPHKLEKKDDSLVLQVRFKPQSVGYHSGFLEIMTDLDEQARYVTLGGEAGADGCGRGSRCGIWPHCLGMRSGIALGLALLYWLLMVIERWNRIARPTRELLRAQIISLQQEIEILPTDKTAPENAQTVVDKLQQLLTEALNLLLGEEQKGVRKVPWSTMLFWSRGEESTGWGYVHEVEVHMAAILDDATVAARLVTEEQKLRAAKDDGLTVLADKIAAATRDGFKAELPVRRALLAEALNANYERGDRAFINMVSWQNKTSYLVVVGLALVVVLAAAFSDQSILLLVGSLGGFISRLSRTLERNEVPTDYGASWTTLFLSPIAGALGAWAGVLLIDLAAKWQVVGSAVAVDWDNAGTNVPTLAIALVFGFSERLLDGVLDALEKSTLANKAAGAPSTSTAPKVTVPPGNGSKQPLKGDGLPAAPIGKPYNATLQGANVQAMPVWALETGELLPDGLTLAPTGVISGTPAAAVVPGTYTFRAKAGPSPTDPVYAFSIEVKAAGEFHAP